VCHALLSEVYLWKKEHDTAIAEAERAVLLAPADAGSYETLADVLAWSGRAPEAIRHIKHAMRLNPQYPFFYLWTLGHAYYLTERNAEAITTFKQLIERNPNFAPAHAFLAVIYLGQGRRSDALAQFAAASRISPHTSLESLKRTLPYRSERDLARLLTAMAQMGVK
jgi:adenylate cyclase